MCLAAGFAVASSASAGTLPDGGVTIQDVVAIFQAKGYRAEEATDSRGDPMIRSSASSYRFTVYFYDCGESRRCKSIQFSAGFTAKGMTTDRINQWNRDRRFGKAHLDKDMDPIVQMDLDLEEGATSENIGTNLERWDFTLGAFAKFLKE